MKSFPFIGQAFSFATCRAGSKIARHTRPLSFILLVFLFALLNVQITTAQPFGSLSPASVSIWQDFRSKVPWHIQEWIVVGEGKSFVLIYSEPPPAFDKTAYNALFRSTFRGYKTSELLSGGLGYNGSRSDFVIELDYAGIQGGRTAFDQDLAKLSTTIFGTPGGASPLRIEEIISSSASNQGRPARISAQVLRAWLLEGDAISLFSPETASRHTLSELLGSGETGRFISTDGSLVVLLVNTGQALGTSDIASTRLFAIDSDFVLGGFVDKATKRVAIVARGRQLSRVAFPPLRVEDILNVITTADDDLAQSYDRTFPGAGRVTIGTTNITGDWAPSYLSADLINTEFGSLLNQADAVLKSQSLSDTIRYEGFQIDAIADPPYPEGVFAKLRNEGAVDSLIFNFNTVGAGHWLIEDGKPDVFALNRLGSFSVTYSPSSYGQASLSVGAAAVADAETKYTAWFDASTNAALTRTVQYMAIYQLFNAARATGIQPYGDRSVRFETIGASLKGTVAQQLDRCIEQATRTDPDFLKLVGADYRSLAAAGGLSGDNIQVPETKANLLERAAKAAIAARYDGNVLGATVKNFEARIRNVQSQYDALSPDYTKVFDKLVPLSQAFDQRYKAYEVRTEGTMIHYRIPSYLGDQFDSDKRELESLENKFQSLSSSLQTLDSGYEKLIDERDKELSVLAGDRPLLDALTARCDAIDAEFSPRIATAFATASKPTTATDRLYAIETPTIVVSRDQVDVSSVGGHNVERRALEVAIEPGIAPGQYRFSGDRLEISSVDATKMSEIATRMSRVAAADVETQTKAFTDALLSQTGGPTERLAALGIDGTNRVRGANLVSTLVALSDHTERLAENTIKIGRQIDDGQLFIDGTSPGGVERIKVFGAYHLPTIMNMRSSGKPITTVILDGSIPPREVDAIISNYKHAGQPGGGGWGKPPSSHQVLPPDMPERPRLLVFMDDTTQRRRVFVRTNKGQIEVLAGKGVKEADLIKALQEGIERNATITLEATSVSESKGGSYFLVTDFRIHQSKTLPGTITVKRPGLGGLLENTIDQLRKTIESAFGRSRDSGIDTVADTLVTIKYDVEGKLPGYQLTTTIDVPTGNLRFVLDTETGVVTADKA